MSGTQVFTNERFGSIRAVEQDGRPWLVAKDVCTMLGLGRQQDYSSLYRNTEKRYCMVDTIRDYREMVVISPSAFETLAAVSKCDDRADIRDWVSREVLPSMGFDGLSAETDAAAMRGAARATPAEGGHAGDGGELIARALLIAKEIIDRNGDGRAMAPDGIADISRRLAAVGEQLGGIASDLAGMA